MKGELLEAKLVHSIVGAFFDVYNYFGYGFGERVYAGALEHELRDRGLCVTRELAIEVAYKNRLVANQRLDMVIENRVVIENKAVEKVTDADRRQLISYLRATQFEVGILLHFGPEPRFERFIDYPKKEPDAHRQPNSA